MKLKILWMMTWILFMSFVHAQKNSLSTSTVVFKVFGNCEMCKERIEEAAKGKGIKSAIWDVDSKMLTLIYEPSSTAPEKVQQRIADVGHDTELKKAKDFIYKQLPDCCQYRDNDNTHHDNNEHADHAAATGILTGVVMETDSK